jgi:hypothetical protein
MSSAYTRRSRSSNRKFASQVELLETRCLLNAKMPAQITIQETPSTVAPGTTALLITGTKKNDGITISDNGTGTAGNIFVSLSDGRDYMSTGAVTEIAVQTGTGNDKVTYELDGNLQTSNTELVFVGSGAKQGGGTLQFTANIVGKILPNADLSIIGVPDPKKLTTMTVNESGEIDGTLSAGESELGSKIKPGPESFTLQSTGMIASGGVLDTGIFGGKHNDVANVSYSGTNNGELDLGLTGSGGSDQLSADIFMIAGSTGTVGSSNNVATIKGSGKDHLSFTIHQGTDSTSTTNVFAQVIGTTKKDKVAHTGNVMVKTKGSVSLVS